MKKVQRLRSRFREYAYGNFKSFGSNDLRKINFRRNSARAMIKVSAYDASMAPSEARKLLNKSLNMMVYEFTNKDRLKHSPQITRSNEVVSDDDKISHYEINSDPSDILKISQREQEILESYERPALISRGDRLYERFLVQCCHFGSRITMLNMYYIGLALNNYWILDQKRLAKARKKNS